MNSVARVFVVINLLLAAGFLMAAATFLKQTSNYKQELVDEQTAHADAVAAKEAEAGELRANIQRLQDDLSNSGQSVSALESEKSDLTVRLGAANEAKTQAETQMQTMTGSLTGMDGKVGDLKDRVGGLEGQIERYRQESIDARRERDEAVAARVAAQEELDDVQKTLKATRDNKNLAENLLGKAKTQLASYRAVYPAPAHADQKKVDGQVVRYDAATNVIQVNRGKTHGVSRGYLIDIVRGGNYIGTARIDFVEQDSAVGSMTLNNGDRRPRSGDAMTRL